MTSPPTANGYALWLMPSEEQKPNLNKIVRDLSKEFNSPIFLPHITLLYLEGHTDEENIKNKSEEFLSDLPPIQINSEGIGFEPENYFKCLYFNIIKSQGLTNLNEGLKKLFNIQGSQEYNPHLSLLYANNLEPNKLRDLTTK